MTPMQRRRAAQNTRQTAGFRGIARKTPIPLPTRGLFNEAAQGEVSPNFAAYLHNFRSNGAFIETRPGFEAAAAEAAGITDRIPYEFGLSDATILVRPGVVSAGSATFPRPTASPVSWSALSSNVIIADGAAAPVRFDGTAFTTAGFTTTTGVNESAFDEVLAHHDRAYFWKRGGALEFYYGDLGAVTGELARFPLDRLGNITGGMLDMQSFTLDAGHGMNDVLAIFTTTGQVVVYEGLDPGDPTDWRLTSRINLAPPIGKHAFAQVGADLWILTARGVVSLRQSIVSSKMALVSSVSRPVSDEIVKAVAEGGEWQVHDAADGSMVIVNRVYQGEASQWIYYAESESWATASYPAVRWYNFRGQTRFMMADGGHGTLTFVEGAGEAMTAVWHSAWIRTRGGGLTSIIPTIKAKGPLAIRLAVLTDHNETPEDLAEAWQDVTITPEVAASNGATIAIDEELGCDAVGEVFQIRLEVTAAWAQLVNCNAMII